MMCKYFHYTDWHGTFEIIPVDGIRFFLFYPNKINTTFLFYCPQLILRDYIDAAFERMLDALSLPVPVRYFLCMLDKQGKDIGIDNDVLQAWKSEW